MAAGEVLCGVAFSHLRRAGDPVLKAREDSEGFVFDGIAPWVTGWPLIREVVLAGTLADGRFLYVVAPLAEAPGVEVSSPMRLCAMNASGTVSVEYRGFRVPKERYLKTITRDQMAQNDNLAILAVTPQPFGVARAAITLLHDLGSRRRISQFRLTADALESELDSLRAQVESWIGRTSEEGFRETALGIRARAITHGVRCAHAALAASGGRGNALDHPAQRLFREAMFYTLTAQTPAVQQATLVELCRSGPESQ
jgi:alkylation response protein AidB-like acyl-CoA dehydrogenase